MLWLGSNFSEWIDFKTLINKLFFLLYIMKEDTVAVIAMSGGIDSSVSAVLLKYEGYKLNALFMKNWESDDNNIVCDLEKKFLHILFICKLLKIKLYNTNFSIEYWEKVFIVFLINYKNGYTPNPDILCNFKIKFNILIKFISNIGIKFLATGHYAEVLLYGKKYLLHRSKDKIKDQTYFLYTLNQKQLKKTLFPLSIYTKYTVRKIAKFIDLPNFDTKSSTGICFIGINKFTSFLKKYLLINYGRIKTINNRIVNNHCGIMYYTIGQRFGLKIGSYNNDNSYPWYVIGKIIKTNTIVVSQYVKNFLNFRKRITCLVFYKNNNLLFNYKLINLKCLSIIRYNQSEEKCIIHKLSKNKYYIIFKKFQRSIASGQPIVLYYNNICFFGGVIK